MELRLRPGKDVVTKLMANDPGGRRFFVSCLLCLNPEELKACRLVNKAWAKFIVDEVWKRSRGRKRLEGKLLERWKTAVPPAVELCQTRESVSSIFCNDAYVFCGLHCGEVRVYSFTTGQWVRDLMPGEGETRVRCNRLMSGSKTVVASAAKFGSTPVTATVWSSQDKMEQLYYFNATNHNCLDVTCIHEGADRRQLVDMNVVGSKIALLVFNVSKNKCSLVVIRKGEHIWEEKTLACFLVLSSPKPFLAAAGDWISVTRWPSRQVALQCALWQDDTYRQDIDLPGCQSAPLLATAMDLPFLSLSVRDNDKPCASIKVFRLAADNGMKDICGTVASLVKSIPLGDSWPTMIICNHLLFGFVDWNEATVTLIEKGALADAAAAEPDRRQIDHLGWSSCDMNSTSLVFTRDQRFVLKKDFWNPTKNTL